MSFFVLRWLNSLRRLGSSAFKLDWFDWPKEATNQDHSSPIDLDGDLDWFQLNKSLFAALLRASSFVIVRLATKRVSTWSNVTIPTLAPV